MVRACAEPAPELSFRSEQWFMEEVCRWSQDLRGNPNFQILKPIPSGLAAANAARRAHAPRPKVAVPRVGRRPAPRAYQTKTTGQSKDLFLGSDTSVAGPASGRKSLARIAVEAEQQRKEILAEARAAAAHAAAAQKSGRTRERAKQNLQTSFALGECLALPPAARLPELPKAIQVELLNGITQETEEPSSVPGTGRRSGSCPKDVRFLVRKGGQIDPQTGLTAEQRKLYLQTVQEINCRRERLDKLREMMPDDVLAAAVGPTDSPSSLSGPGRSEASSGVGKEHSLVLQMARCRRARRKVQENLQQETRLQREIEERLKDLRTLKSISKAQLSQET